jgi:hypothetical protein
MTLLEQKGNEKMTKLTRKILARSLWLAKGAALFWGVVLTLAVVLGVGTTALAAVPGDPFRLGRINTVDTASSLVGSVNGAMLTIENNSPGAKAAPAPALSLDAQSGNPPLIANPEAGTATNLSADELDGLDQGAFLRANGKATDADKLDGKDSAQFLAANGKAADADRLDGKDGSAFVSDIYLMQSSKQGNGGGASEVRQAFCDLGDRVLGGGGGSTANPVQDLKDVVIKSQAQIEGPNDESWFVQVRDNGAPSLITAQAICADFTPDH